MTLWRISTVYVARLCPSCGQSRLTIQWISRADPGEHRQRLSARPEFERGKCGRCDYKQIERLEPAQLSHAAAPESA